MRGVSGTSAELVLTRLTRVRRLIGKAMALGYRAVGKHRYDDFRLEWVLGRPFIVIPSVFNPKVPRTGEFLASLIDERRVSSQASVLDLGTGSGVVAVCAARYAARVVAVDITAAAVRCAGLNATLNHLEHKIEVRQGDLFGPVAGERFDLVLFNPPFLRGTPRDDRDRGWRGNDLAERFAAGLEQHLKPHGQALLLLSTFGDGKRFLDELRARRFEVSIAAERRFVNERLAVLQLEKGS